MSEPRDMDAPVTRRELHEALEIWGGALEQRLLGSVKTLFEAFERQFVSAMGIMERRLMTELRAQARGSVERLEDRIGAIDDKYQDLPPRVEKLEAKVFAPRRRKRRRAS